MSVEREYLFLLDASRHWEMVVFSCHGCITTLYSWITATSATQLSFLSMRGFIWNISINTTSLIACFHLHTVSSPLFGNSSFSTHKMLFCYQISVTLKN